MEAAVSLIAEWKRGVHKRILLVIGTTRPHHTTPVPLCQERKSLTKNASIHRATMKFTSAAIVLFTGSVSSFVPHAGVARRTFVTLQSSVTEEERIPTKKDGRLRFMQDEQFHRKGFKDVRGEVEAVMTEQFMSGLVNDMKTNQFVIEREGVRVHLAKVSGTFVILILYMHAFVRQSHQQIFKPLTNVGLWILLGR